MHSQYRKVPILSFQVLQLGAFRIRSSRYPSLSGLPISEMASLSTIIRSNAYTYYVLRIV